MAIDPSTGTIGKLRAKTVKIVAVWGEENTYTPSNGER